MTPWVRRAGLLFGTAAMFAIGAYGWSLARVAGVFAEAPPAHADAAIVLGAAVWRDGPSPALQRRLGAASAVFTAQRVQWIVTTGGLGRFAPTEGEASRDWLAARGIPLERIVVENRSHTTWENLSFAMSELRRHGIRRVFIVSDGYHLARGVRMARDLGLEAWGVSADGPPRDVITRDPSRWFGEAANYLAYALGAEK